MKRNVLIINLLITLTCGVSCKKSNDITSAPDNGTPTTTTTTPKNPIVGLVTQGTASSTDSTWVPDNTFPEVNAHPNVYAAVVIRVTWKQLEPAQG